MLLLETRNKQGSIGIIHFVGIGGIGMSGIAEILHNLGYLVQGSDLQVNANTSRLASFGIKIFEGHDQNNLEGVSYVVISSAVKENNIEVTSAKEMHIPVIKRSDMLAELMRLKSSIAISGSHGKTTTTSLVACLFEAAGHKPTVINGGIINNRFTNAYVGEGDYLIAEADESDATFIKIPSTIGAITNIDYEHLDYYNSFENLVDSFKQFLLNLPFYGFGVACIDDPIVRKLVTQITGKKIITYGIDSPDANIRAENINLGVNSSTFDVVINISSSTQAKISGVTIPVAGRHNVLNSLVAISIGFELDFGIKVLRDGFKKFKGVKRRFSRINTIGGVDIVDDYAHHPTEIKATLATARTLADSRGGKVIAVFQPHRYSRLKNLFDGFCSSFEDADHVFVLPVYSAGEADIYEVSAEILVNGITNKKKDCITRDQLADIFKKTCAPNDIFLMMGAGTVSAWAQSLAEELEEC